MFLIEFVKIFNEKKKNEKKIFIFSKILIFVQK